MDNKSKPTENRDSQKEFLRPPMEAQKSRWGFQDKTVWDWLELLVVPLALAIIGFLFAMQQEARQQAFEEQQRALEGQRAETAQWLEEQRTQDARLQAYLDQMSTLLLEEGLRSSQEDSELRTLARARTLTTLRNLDPERRTDLIRFLEEAELIQGVNGEGPVISLSRANLEDTNLALLDLSKANLAFANLSDATLVGANLSDAKLEGVILIGADLSSAKGVTAEQLKQEVLTPAYDLEGAIMPEGWKYP